MLEHVGKKKVLIIIEIIFLTAGLISIFMYKDSMFLGSLDKFDNDDVKYIRSAWTLIDSGTLTYEDVSKPTVYIMPGLTVVLSLFMIIFGKMSGILAFKIFQLLLQGLSIYLVFLIAKKIFNESVAIIASALSLIYVADLFAANVILMECIFKFLLLLLIYISIHAVEKKWLFLYIVGGIVWGFSCFFRPTIGAFPIVVLIMWIKNKYKLSEMVRYSVVVLSLFCLVMSPWWIRNFKQFNMFIPFTKSSGNPFLQGTFINYDSSTGWIGYEKTNNPIVNDENEFNAGLRRLEVYGKKEPLKYTCWYTVGKTIRFWRIPFYWREVFNISYTIAFWPHLLILILGVSGIIMNIRKSNNILFIFIVIVYFNLIYLPYFTFARYSYPLMSILMIFAASGIYNIYLLPKRWGISG